ncbi:MAG: SusC/RagA family TonB-linked outer membrane protein [Gemmatimonadales bacterium]|nr:SusC/RagA family TonB-linked outer membrane protein [Gemmatimonadales bacterium]NIN11854.1 SusC/RagA family TonB-linked outer membrane protein [Gemmatimonadales bacterium]NIN50404.1 SusC/RagA family TonB-linked outer membrane protein [Gemmatimonadales bacterium]NIP07868.1 SusC/RagA family TonB-linked outer membrane protein [Gemmatimonadales bacterium]NIR02073.1 SusC/RagA family TonB-linked outer membrane protein [Gemmatimonadales bacterium]
MRLTRSVLAFGAFLLVAAGGAVPAEAQTGAVRGRVVSQATDQPIADVVIEFVGTNRTVRSGANGEYEFINVPIGRVTLRASMIGFAAQTVEVNVAAGLAATVDFVLRPVVISLDAFVVTATGEKRVREVANVITTLDAAKAVEEVAPPSLASLIQGRSPGVQIINSSGTTGTGTKVRIRGSSSISLSNEPLLVVDGVRVDNRQNDIGFVTGGQTISRINDFNPDDIESIEIVKGPSAAALYGTAAANGVIVVTTKRGRVGAPVWNAYVEQGIIREANQYPDNYRGLDDSGSTCRLAQVSAGSCTQAELQTSNPLESKTTSPFKTGRRQQYGLNVAGGSSQVQYYVSGEWEVENGVYGLPQQTQDSILEFRDEIPDFALNPNRLKRGSVRANLNALLGEKATLNVSSGYVSADIGLPQNDNNVMGMLPSGYFGSSDSTDNGGWGFFTPEEVFFVEGKQQIERFTNSLNLNWHPTTWLEGRATVGADFANKSDIRFQATGSGPNFANYLEGFRVSDKTNTYSYTVDLGATAYLRLSNRLSSKTSAGFQYFRNNREQVETTGQVLPPGAGSQKSASDQFIDEDFIDTKTVGTFFEQQFGFDDRLFVTGAIRGDDNSAFGQDFDFTVYPKLGISYLAVENPGGVLDNLRFRGAWGASGQQPGTNDAEKSYTGISFVEGGEELAGVTINNPGNTALKPERSSEIEVGFESGLFGGRLGVDFTYYRRKTTDALVQRQLAPSLGLGQQRWENIGETLNWGFEAGVNAAIVRSPMFSWNLGLTGSTNTNKLIELGEGVEPIVFQGGRQKHQEDYPMGSYWQEPFTFEDANGDGIITVDELTIGDTTEFMGYARPRYEAALYNSIDIGGRFRISGLLDYRGGHKLHNFTEAFRCRMNVCRGLSDPAAPLDEQARAQTQKASVQTVAGFLEPGWFLKLRELSFTFFAPDSWARVLGADRVSLTVSGRNLLTITDYTGVDPEVQGGTGNFGSLDFLTQPQVRYWTARLQLTF